MGFGQQAAQSGRWSPPNRTTARARRRLRARSSLLAGVAVVLMGMVGAPPVDLADTFSQDLLIPVAILLGVTLLAGGIGFFIGGRRAKRTSD